MSNWSPNLILVDADFLDDVVFDMIIHFEPVIGRHLPAADLCHWLDCIALDGGLRQDKHDIQVVFIHSKEKEALKQFTPAHFENELNGKAFNDYIGEFTLQSFPVEDIVSQSEFFEQSLSMALESQVVKRIMVVGNMETYGENIVKTISKTKDKDIILFTMRPSEEGEFKQEILGYSLLAALGIRGDELQ